MQCTEPSCLEWQHEECLINLALARIWLNKGGIQETARSKKGIARKKNNKKQRQTLLPWRKVLTGEVQYAAPTPDQTTSVNDDIITTGKIIVKKATVVEAMVEACCMCCNRKSLKGGAVKGAIDKLL